MVAGGAGVASASGAGGAGTPAAHPHDPMAGNSGSVAAGHAGSNAQHACPLHFAADPRDEQLPNEPLTQTVGLSKDLLVPQLVLNWMDENEFAQAHDGWHLARKWDQSCRKSNATEASCAAAQRLAAQGLTRAPIQQGAPGDGLAFMMMHRHMIVMLKETFPKHAALFDGFKHVPRTTSDAENITTWRRLSWTSDNIKGFDILDNIEKNVAMFASDDDLGQFIENTYRWTAQNPMNPANQAGAGLHGALHSQWAVSGSPANLIQQSVDVKNFMFWKLHGWIDQVWDRYRKAKNLTDDDPKYQQILLEQCLEMHALQPRNRGTSQTTPTNGAAGSGGATAPETGVFATSVRPLFDTTCAGCHSAIAPSAGMTLGGTGISSAEVRLGLVGVKANNGEYNLIEPGDPNKSWLYLKASGRATNATCTSNCDREPMPPSGVGLTADQLQTLSAWIVAGATDK
jgi:hypothetical protein